MKKNKDIPPEVAARRAKRRQQRDKSITATVQNARYDRSHLSFDLDAETILPKTTNDGEAARDPAGD